MKLSLIFILSCLTLASTSLYAQNTSNRRPAGFYCPTIQPYDTGNAARAFLKHKTATEDTFSIPRVRLGYIYSDTATQQEVMDNLQVGLRVIHFSNYRIVSFEYFIVPKGGDCIVGPKTQGNKLRGLGYSECPFWRLHHGDIVYFSAYAIKDGETLLRHMNDTKIIIH